MLRSSSASTVLHNLGHLSMPPERSRGDNSQRRQKSCAECAKAKRRCGLEHPSCTRCRKQHLVCVYPQQSRPQPITSQKSTLGPQDEFELFDMPLDFQEGGATNLSLSFDATLNPSPDASALDFDFSTGFSSLDSLSSMINNSPNEQHELAVQNGFFPVTRPFSQAHIIPFAKSRIEYSISQLKTAPRMMVEQNCTPWAHRKLYEEFMPRSLQDAHAACALFITKNDTNAEYVARHITHRAEEILTLNPRTEPVDILAHAHALMLYLVMLVFGNDMRLFAQADALITTLEEIGESLLTMSRQEVDTSGTLPLYPSTTACAAWRAYIFRESVRRTVLSLFQFTTICNLLRGQLTSCGPAISRGNKVFLSAHLWTATNALDFAIAWNNKKHFLVKDLDFTDVLRDAKSDDVDIFGKMMLVGLRGIDEIRVWFYTRGGEL